MAVVGGLTLAGTMSMTAALDADLNGRFSGGSILGAVFLAHQTGAAAASWRAGALVEASGGYGIAFAIRARSWWRRRW